MSTASPRPRFVIDVVEQPFTLCIANEQHDVIRFSCTGLEENVFAPVEDSALIQYPLMACAELIRHERDKRA